MNTLYFLTASRQNRIVRRFTRAIGVLAVLAAMLNAMSVSASPSPITIWIKVARGPHCQGGLGLCGGFGNPPAGVARTAATFEVRRDVATGLSTKMTITFPEGVNEQGDEFVVAEDITLDRALSVRLGYQQVKIKRGTYQVKRSASSPAVSVDVDVEALGIYIEIVIGKRMLGCRDFGICSITIGSDALHRAKGSASIEGNRMGVDFLLEIEPDTASEITLDEDIVLDTKTSLALGYQSVKVRKGTYKIDRSVNRYGHIDLDVETQGITIIVKLGRAWHVCRGFGICDIVIDAAMLNSDAASAPASASLDGNRLHVDFLLEIDDTMDAITIDEDIVLDGKTAIALGARELKIRKGTYKIDRRTNANGSVDLPVERIGITIHIEAGRKSKGCTGFGICSIDIEFSLRTANGLPTVLSYAGGKATLDFMKRPQSAGNEPFVIEEPMVIRGRAAHGLGLIQLTLAPGTYHVDYSSNPNGTVVVPAAPMGIVIRIKIGRPYHGCTGFGFCGIDIDASSASNERGAVAHATKSTLFVELTEGTAEKGDVLVIDEDIELSTETSAALGYPSVTIKRGSYPVDYSTNPNGSVALALNDDGTASVESAMELASRSSMSVVPNPATAVTTFGFAVDAPQTVTLTLLDARGAVVMTVVDGERLPAGRHERMVDVSSLPSGAYFQRLTIGSVSAIKPVQIAR